MKVFMNDKCQIISAKCQLSLMKLFNDANGLALMDWRQLALLALMGKRL